MELPQEFLSRMKKLLPDDYEAFLKSYNQERSQGLRVNTLKIAKEDFLALSPFSQKPIPWAQDGFYYEKSERPGRHPYHEAGLYYIQEPSAMAVAQLLAPQPGETVLDLCAAPGGKSTHIASQMKQQGLLISNEIHPTRASILAQNMERMGISNAIVTNETPARLAEKFPAFFDRILVDAPCSGEGMFRKDPDARAEWSLENVKICSERQLSILKEAEKMLKASGRLVYSTCTFSPEENEGVISKFLKAYPQFQIENIKTNYPFSCGNPNFIENANPDLTKTFRLWPHKLLGEGHFIAVLKKTDGKPKSSLDESHIPLSFNLLKDYFSFVNETLTFSLNEKLILFGNQLYKLPEIAPPIDRIKILRPGLHLGTLKKNRFEPSHALALMLAKEQVKSSLNFSKDSDEIRAFLSGQSFTASGHKGWCLVTVDGYSIGWGKLSDSLLKNHYPKGLRWRM